MHSSSTVSTDLSAAAEPDSGPSLQGVLWDMDGTLVDTEPYWIEAEMELVQRHGGTWTEDQATACVGQALSTSATMLQAAGVDRTVRQIIDELIGKVTDRVSEQVPWRPGAWELLAELRAAGVPCALVTMSEQLLAREIERQLPEGTFEFLLTGDMVGRGKPDPEPYQRGLELLQRRNDQAGEDTVVALEDSLPGVTSAQAAGLITVGIAHVVPLPADSGRVLWDTLAGRTVADLQQLVAERAATRGHK